MEGRLNGLIYRSMGEKLARWTAVGLINRDYSHDIGGSRISETELNRIERDVNIYIYYFHVNETLIYPILRLLLRVIRSGTNSKGIFVASRVYRNPKFRNYIDHSKACNFTAELRT